MAWRCVLTLAVFLQMSPPRTTVGGSAWVPVLGAHESFFMAATRRNSSGSVRESGQGTQWSSWQPGHPRVRAVDVRHGTPYRPRRRSQRTTVSSSSAEASRFRLLHRQHRSATFPVTYPRAGTRRSMVGEESLFAFPSGLRRNVRPQHSQASWRRSHSTSFSTVKASASHARLRRALRSRMPSRRTTARFRHGSVAHCCASRRRAVTRSPVASA